MANEPRNLEHHRWRPWPAQAEAAAGPGRPTVWSIKVLSCTVPVRLMANSNWECRTANQKTDCMPSEGQITGTTERRSQGQFSGS